MGEFMWNYLQSMLAGSSEVSEGATSPEPRRGPPSVCLGVGLSERRLFLANSRVSIQAAVRARLGLVSPAVGAAAVQRGALQDQQPSGEIHQSRIPVDGCVTMATLAVVLLLLSAGEWPAQTYKVVTKLRLQTLMQKLICRHGRGANGYTKSIISI